MNYDDHDPTHEHKCAACDMIAGRREPFWQFAANLPFHYVCSNKCATDLKSILEANKLAKANKKS